MNAKTIIIGGVVVVGVYLFFKNEAKAAVDKINPTNPDNIVYSGVSTIPDLLDDGVLNDSSTYGTFIYNITHWWDE